MKVINFFAQVFTIFAFLTLGSLMMIVSFHILDYEDAALKLQDLYGNSWQSFQMGIGGIVFILVGLIFTKILIKQGKQTEALIFQSEIGPIVVSTAAIEDTVRKVAKRFHLVKDCRIKIRIEGKNVELKLGLTLWSGSRVPELVSEVQEEVRSRVKKLIGTETKLEITCDVQKIEDHEADFPVADTGHAVSL